MQTLLPLLAMALLLGCKKEDGVPILSAPMISVITQNTAHCHCRVSDNGGADVKYIGVYWGTTPNPTMAGDKIQQENNIGAFSADLTDLLAGTTYYIRGYANNSAGTGYGEETIFTTVAPLLPLVSSASPSSITQTAATCGGELTYEGGTPTTCGLCWGTSENPTTSDAKTELSTALGSFFHTYTGLSPNTTYHVRAYATNLVGTVYGADMTVRTMYGSVIDVDGNEYRTVLIGTQEWMADNLKVIHYCTGDPIANVTDNIQWANTILSGAYCAYENNEINAAKYGLLYNYYAVDDSKGLCPDGWHVPTDAEWITLTDYFGGASVAGLKLKSIDLWDYNAQGTDNSSGFTGLPSGNRYADGSFHMKGAVGEWWSSSVYRNYAWVFRLVDFYAGIFNYNFDKRYGHSIRCLRN